MQNTLYFICPTDCLESVINNTFKNENYFYTSLGNSFNIDNNILARIKCLVKKHQIKKMCFVLSSDNKIIEDAVNHQDFSNINGLNNFYKDISKQQQSVIIYNNQQQGLSMLSYILNKKVQELQVKLAAVTNCFIEINAEIFDRNSNAFIPVYSNLLCLKKYQLN